MSTASVSEKDLPEYCIRGETSSTISAFPLETTAMTIKVNKLTLIYDIEFQTQMTGNSLSQTFPSDYLSELLSLFPQ